MPVVAEWRRRCQLSLGTDSASGCILSLTFDTVHYIYIPGKRDDLPVRICTHVGHYKLANNTRR